MIGNIVVSLAWFGPQLNGLNQYATVGQSMLPDGRRGQSRLFGDWILLCWLATV